MVFDAIDIERQNRYLDEKDNYNIAIDIRAYEPAESRCRIALRHAIVSVTSPTP